MNIADAEALLRARFRTEWDDTTPVAWPNAGFDPVKDAPGVAYVRFSVVAAEGEAASFGDPGNNLKRYPALITVEVHAPLNEGSDDALRLAVAACEPFKGWAHSGLLFRIPPWVRVIGEGDASYRVNSIIPFEFEDYF